MHTSSRQVGDKHMRYCGACGELTKCLGSVVIKGRLETHQGVLQVCVSVRYRAPSWYSILRTPRLVPMA
jgi:hypothetical protein